MGMDWKESKLIEKYRLIQNIPENFLDKESEIDIKLVYPNLIFEWKNTELLV